MVSDTVGAFSYSYNKTLTSSLYYIDNAIDILYRVVYRTELSVVSHVSLSIQLVATETWFGFRYTS